MDVETYKRLSSEKRKAQGLPAYIEDRAVLQVFVNALKAARPSGAKTT